MRKAGEVLLVAEMGALGGKEFLLSVPRFRSAELCPKYSRRPEVVSQLRAGRSLFLSKERVLVWFGSGFHVRAQWRSDSLRRSRDARGRVRKFSLLCLGRRVRT